MAEELKPFGLTKDDVMELVKELLEDLNGRSNVEMIKKNCENVNEQESISHNNKI